MGFRHEGPMGTKNTHWFVGEEIATKNSWSHFNQLINVYINSC